MPLRKDFNIIQGSTFSEKIRWETTPFVYKPITAIEKTAPARITVAAHGLPDGWRAAIVSVKGMIEINAPTPPKDKYFLETTFIDSNTIEINSVNASEYHTYTSGGYVQYYTPKDLTGYTARMTVRNRVGGTALVTLTTANNGIVIDLTDKFIELVITATDSAGYSWTKGVYDLELVSLSGEVTSLLHGNVTLTKEVTT